MCRDVAKETATTVITHEGNRQVCKYIVNNESQASQKGVSKMEKGKAKTNSVILDLNWRYLCQLMVFNLGRSINKQVSACMHTHMQIELRRIYTYIYVHRCMHVHTHMASAYCKCYFLKTSKSISYEMLTLVICGMPK